MIAYPFSAIVGQEEMRRALRIAAVSPEAGGVLLSGRRGTAKSTAARALAGILPRIRTTSGCAFACDPARPCGHCPGGEVVECDAPFATLPLGATEDRVIGTLDLEAAVRRGERRFEPGVLARANRGVLYVDEVNLLEDHLVDLLLDVAASGVNAVEREGLSLRHPARFLLIGTMNPEEGELRPQLLDRFAFAVEVDELEEPELRVEGARRAVEFERDPEAFLARWREQEDDLRRRITEARSLLPRVGVPDAMAHRIADRCLAERVEGLRADIAIRKGAAVLAAWEGRREVGEEDVECVARLALRHRRGEETPPPSPPPPPSRPPTGGDGEGRERGSGADGESRVDPDPPKRLPRPEVGGPRAPRARREGQGRLRRGAPRTAARRGPQVGTVRLREGREELALADSLRAAALRGPSSAGAQGGQPGLLAPDELRARLRRAPAERLYLLVLDTSRSMATGRRIRAAKSFLLGMLRDSHRRRERVGLVAFRGREARLVIPPATRSARRCERALAELTVGGGTPLARGLRLAADVAHREGRRQPGVQTVVILVSDGRPTQGLGGHGPARAAELELARLVRSDTTLLLVDTEEGPVRLGFLARWSARWGLPRVELDALRAGRVRALVGGRRR